MKRTNSIKQMVITIAFGMLVVNCSSSSNFDAVPTTSSFTLTDTESNLDISSSLEPSSGENIWAYNKMYCSTEPNGYAFSGSISFDEDSLVYFDTSSELYTDPTQLPMSGVITLTTVDMYYDNENDDANAVVFNDIRTDQGRGYNLATATFTITTVTTETISGILEVNLQNPDGEEIGSLQVIYTDVTLSGATNCGNGVLGD